MSLQFTKAGTSDVPVLNAISKHAFESDVEVGAPSTGGPPGYMSMKYHMKMARSGHLYKLTENGLIIGGAILFPDGDTLNIGRIFVNPDHHRKGYGKRMMHEIEALFPEIKVFKLDTPAWNVRTNQFYSGLGYKEVERNQEFIYYSKNVQAKQNERFVYREVPANDSARRDFGWYRMDCTRLSIFRVPLPLPLRS